MQVVFSLALQVIEMSEFTEVCENFELLWFIH